MRRIRSHLLGVDRGSQVLFSDFEHDGEMWTGSGPREFRCAVAFSEAFLTPPEVTVSMSMWDLDQQTNQRVDLSAEEISETGFDIVFRTWGDTRVARVRSDWIAIGEVSDEDSWDV
ncbi:H-type lectin domain-containing protein [Aliiroseovarius marinus]|uniref:H-type lectin domain-containing protein n=1 Tax=Aliiroseovarius marinus TaxID=2500159 RepID=UPI003D7C7305